MIGQRDFAAAVLLPHAAAAAAALQQQSAVVILTAAVELLGIAIISGFEVSGHSTRQFNSTSAAVFFWSAALGPRHAALFHGSKNNCITKQADQQRQKRRSTSPRPDVIGEDGMLADIDVQPLVQPEIRSNPSADVFHFSGKPFSKSGKDGGGGSEIGNNSASASKDLVTDASTNRRHYAKFHKTEYHAWCEKNDFESKLEEDVKWLIATDQPIDTLTHPKFKEMMDIPARATEASNTDGYYAITGHWMEETTPGVWALREALLGFTHMNNAHHGIRLGQTLFKIVERLGITNCVGIPWKGGSTASRTKSLHYNPHEPHTHVPETDDIMRDEIGLLRAIAVKERSSSQWKELFRNIQLRNHAVPDEAAKQMIL
ncbi:hypothetical protein DFH08DRAFT_825124 [Mycena albidolilacea]|uniref:Uncharacterized protein n=1 Tax=Mycena albidolilacea TaxID=1033008 RepID=A0AAD6Z3B1_9AGAR|nr:hypothetical protein DFH08DRAFT_825124 [Mycena albidolilacea]